MYRRALERLGTTPGRPWIGSLILSWLAVYLAAVASLTFALHGERTSPLWLPDAVSLAICLGTAARRWPALLGACFIALVCAHLTCHDGVPVSLLLSSCNMLEVLICASIVRRFIGRNVDLTLSRDLGIFLLACAVAPIVPSALAAFAMGLLRSEHTPFLLWAMANAVGLVMLTPLLLTVSNIRVHLQDCPITPSRLVPLGLLVVVTAAVFGQTTYPVMFVVLPLWAWATFELEIVGVAAGAVLVGLIAIALTAFDRGPVMLVLADSTRKLLLLEIFIAFWTVTMLRFTAVVIQRRRTTSRLKEMAAEAEQATRIKSEFLANMSHELRTPLTAILGFSNLAEGQPDLPPDARRCIEQINVSSKVLLTLVNDVLDFSKLEAGEIRILPRPTDVAALAREILDMFAEQSRARGVTLDLHLARSVPQAVLLDADRTRQLLINLVGNAVKFTDKGSVTVDIGYDGLAQQLSVAIVDTGPGIDADRKSLLFRRFSQIDGSATRAYGGTGLGLAICKGLIERMEGRIGVETELGVGSRFWFDLPAQAVEPEHPAEPAVDPTPPMLGRRFLVVDDNPANRALVRAVLTAMGAEIAEAEDGVKGISAAAEMLFDVILMDLRMPGMGGDEAVAAIRHGLGPNAATPIIAFSASADSHQEVELRRRGFDGVLAKPFSPRGFIAAVEGALVYRRSTADLGLRAAGSTG